jgi:predicted CoA-binding protein
MSEPRAVLEQYRTVAVVGASRDPAKEAHQIPRLLKDAGFRVIPVNPKADEILGEPVYRRLADVPEPVEIVEVFRPAAEAADVARQAVEIGARAVWLQLGIRSDEARRIAEEAGLDYVEDRCMGAETRRHGIRK